MSEGNVQPHSDFNELNSVARTEQASAQQLPHSSVNGDWETIPLPGMFPLDATSAASPSKLPKASPEVRQAELLARIQDLNQCNEVLLTRVNQLEEALERSHQALQQEIERSHRITEEERVAAAQNHSVAQLLSELEQANAVLERQAILAETLEAQLQTFQERSQQLERECALLRKQHAEKVHQLELSEATCADLRSRLQRQQQYTLQFKAALEKSLDTSAFSHAGLALEPEELTGHLNYVAPSGVANPLMMPRAERIQPWSVKGATVPADEQLLSLVRANQSSSQPPQPSESSISHQPEPLPEMLVDKKVADFVAPTHETAEQQLWQDVERVMENAHPSTAALPVPETLPAKSNELSTLEEVQFTEPIPWGTPVAKAAAPSEVSPSSAPEDSEVAQRGVAVEPLIPDSATEQLHEAVSSRRPPGVPEAYRQSAIAANIPALNVMKMTPSSPSPVVHPLKPAQRKLKSLSAVELPSFPPLPKPKVQEPTQ